MSQNFNGMKFNCLGHLFWVTFVLQKSLCQPRQHDLQLSFTVCYSEAFHASYLKNVYTTHGRISNKFVIVLFNSVRLQRYVLWRHFCKYISMNLESIKNISELIGFVLYNEINSLSVVEQEPTSSTWLNRPWGFGSSLPSSPLPISFVSCPSVFHPPCSIAPRMCFLSITHGI